MGGREEGGREEAGKERACFWGFCFDFFFLLPEKKNKP